MSFDLLASLDNKVTSYDIAQLVETLEMDEKNVAADRNLVCAAVLAGLVKKCSSERGVASLGALVSGISSETGSSSDMPEAEPAVDLHKLVDDGHSALDKIFGSGLNNLMGAIGSYCKSDRYQLSKLFSLTGATVIEKLHEIKVDKKLADNEDIAALVLGQSAIVREALPDNLYAALGLRNLGGYAEKLLTERGDRVTKAMAKPDANGIENLLVRKLLPVGGVVLLLIVCWTLFRSCQ